MVEENKVVIKFLKVEFEGDWGVSRSNPSDSWATYTLKGVLDGMEKGKVKIFSKEKTVTYLILRNGSVGITSDVAHIVYDSIEPS